MHAGYLRSAASEAEEMAMQTLNGRISRYMQKITAILVVALIISITVLEVGNEQRLEYKSAGETFTRIEQMLKENEEEAEALKEQYTQSCLRSAKGIAYILELNASAKNDRDELLKIAGFTGVDEIHIIDESGKIVSGTHPAYYGYTFNSGEQMQFFLPMLKDRSLELVQDIEPNTAEGKLMQYSAVWNGDRTFIVQVGMEPVRLTELMRKNTLSYIFSQLNVNTGVYYYAVNAQSGEIVGATDTELNGENIRKIGLAMENLKRSGKGFSSVVNKRHSYCVFEKIGGNYIGVTVESRVLYAGLPINLLYLALCLITIAAVLFFAVTRYMNRYVVKRITELNEKLYRIGQGELEEVTMKDESREFTELGKYINEMVSSLSENMKKMAYVLKRTNLHIGTYEYNRHKKKVRFTEEVSGIFELSEAEASELAADKEKFQDFLEKVRKQTLEGEPGIFCVQKETVRYIKLEEVQGKNGETFGVVIDVTEETVRRRRLEAERDLDLLTGLYSRPGRDAKLPELLKQCRPPYYSAVVMIDADNLKKINDTYGHGMGDRYLKRIAKCLEPYAAANCLVCRQGGDEFTLFFYHYGQKEKLLAQLEQLKACRGGEKIKLSEEIEVTLEFSIGYSIGYGEIDYNALYHEADDRMYEDKRERKMERTS